MASNKKQTSKAVAISNETYITGCAKTTLHSRPKWQLCHNSSIPYKATITLSGGIRSGCRLILLIYTNGEYPRHSVDQGLSTSPRQFLTITLYAYLEGRQSPLSFLRLTRASIQQRSDCFIFCAEQSPWRRVMVRTSIAYHMVILPVIGKNPVLGCHPFFLLLMTTQISPGFQAPSS